jgi:aminoglycoside phosphotransferase (APT) family kinase protein
LRNTLSVQSAATLVYWRDKPTPKSPLSSNGQWCVAPSPIDVLVGCGWLRASDAGDPALRIDAVSSSHALFRVTAPDGRAVIVKQVPEKAAQRGRNLAREMFVYRLAHWMPAIATLVPRPIVIDERRDLLVVESLASGPVWPDVADVASVASSDVCLQLGRAMAAWHSSTNDIGAWPSLGVGVFGLPDSLSEACHGRPRSTQALMDSIGADAVLAGALREARSSYAHRCLIHGDLRRENWILDRRNGSPSLKVFDWEMSGIGDPAWDIGSVVAEAVLEQIRERRIEQSRSVVWPPAIEAPMKAFLHAYSASNGVLDVRDLKSWEMMTLCTVGRLLHVACECADLAADANGWPVSDIVKSARTIATRRRKAAAALGRWGSS